MFEFLQTLTSGTPYLLPIVVCLLVLFVLIVALYIFGFVSGRELSFWPPKIGAKTKDLTYTDTTQKRDKASGLVDWKANSKEVDDRSEWRSAPNLTIGLMYSPQFVKNFCDVLQARCASRRFTTILLIDPNCIAAIFLQQSSSASGRIAESHREICHVVREVDQDGQYIRLMAHEQYLRYSFISTDQAIWIKFYTNTRERAIVPALKFQAGSAIFEFFDNDIRRLHETSHATR